MDPQAVSVTATLKPIKLGNWAWESDTSGSSEGDSPENSLEGIWTGNDGGTYQIRQRGNELWWYGRSADGGLHWQHVFHGVMKEPGVYEGKWADLPPGRNQLSGSISVRFDGKVLQRIAVTGGFLGSQWQRGGAVSFSPTDSGATGERK